MQISNCDHRNFESVNQSLDLAGSATFVSTTFSLIFTILHAFNFAFNYKIKTIQISHFQIEQKTGSSRLFGGTKINNMPNMASRKFSYIPKVLCAA